MNNEVSSRDKTKKIVWLAVLFALVVLLQSVGGYIKIGTVSINLVLVPVVLGGIFMGLTGGLILGLVASTVIMIMGFVGQDPFTNTLFAHNLWGTLAVIYAKGVLSAVIPALIYKALKNKHEKVGIILASVCAPVINTGIFIVGMLFMSGVLVEVGFVDDASGVVYFLFIVCAGINFIVEFAINLVLSPAICRVVSVVGKNKGE